MIPLGKVWTFAVGKPATVRTVAQALHKLGVDGATILPAIGIWQGERESSVIVRIAGLKARRADAIATALRQWFKQEAIYVESDGRAYLNAA